MTRGPRVVALGDSITLGIGDGVQHSDGSVGWAALTAQALGASRFVNLAANGVRARDLLRDQVAIAAAEFPDVVLLTVGGNDVLRGDFCATEVEDALGDAVTVLAQPGRRIVAIRLERIGLFDLAPKAVTDVMARRIAQVNAAIARVAARGGVELLDGGRVIESVGAEAWHIDRIHPSPAGHRALARAAVARLSDPRVADAWPAARPIPAAPKPPSRLAIATWLVVNGAPWLLKRSRDLLPQIAGVVMRGLADERRARPTGGHAVEGYAPVEA
ncbi:SGNH/GDSL hydrolase family protein [Demequina pelophila]|uniref:SGNH/GDSL hydrolase family protein n=1 Tax=Demequina pelophila TaxID=1638984 RepID=UPI000B21873F|nr:GDSL-type esterase/lipase family protein [Demequina pelophila]